jgi:hypothetical protein
LQKTLTDLFSLTSLALLALLPPTSALAEPHGDLAAFSAFKDIKIESLAGGTVKAARGPAMNFPRGLAVESCYVVKKPLGKAAELHLQWTPAQHPELKVYLHNDLPARPTLADFSKMAAAPANGAVKSFVTATRKLSSSPAGLQMSNAEAKSFAGDPSQGAAMSQPVAAFWSNLLFHRAQAFLGGGITRLPPYETSGETIRSSEEIARLLKEAGKWRSQFSALLDATPLAGGKGGLKPSPYWEMLDVEGEAAVSLGALYHKAGDSTWQSVDVQYYASGGFYVLLTFQQMWPVTIAGQECTLVWRGDLISAASLATLHGVERMGSSTAMMRETQKSIGAFLSDIAKAP